MSGRRAAFGVTLKNARRNKKRTFYLVTLITVPVLVAVVTSAFIRAGYISPAEQAGLEYGAANVKIEQSGTEPELTGWVARTVGELDAEAASVTYRQDFRSYGPGLFGRVMDLDLADPLSDGILTLTIGRPPSSEDEVVLTEFLADQMAVTVGDRVDLALRRGEETSYEVVGLTSHPVMWRQADVVASKELVDTLAEGRAMNQITLVDAGEDSSFVAALNQRFEAVRYDFYPDDVEWPVPDSLNFLPEEYYAAMTTEELEETRSLVDTGDLDRAIDYAFGLFPNGTTITLPQFYAESLTDRLQWNATTLTESPPVMGTAVAAVILAEVAFIAGAAFATGTRRRLREIGLMGANGASVGHVRTLVVSEGLVTGLLGGLLGSAIALASMMVARPLMQRFVERRIEEFPLTALDLAGPILVAVVACVLAAWLPAKTAAGVPTLTALQGRMPVGGPKRWIIPAGLVMTAFGTLLLGVGLATASDRGSAVAVIGAVLMIGGAALLGGPLVAWLSRYAERVPVTTRIVLRDSGRHRSRAAAAVAATMVIMLIPVVALAALANGAAEQRTYGLEPREPQIILEGRQDEFGNTIPYESSDLDLARASLPEATIAEFTVFDVPVSYPAEWEATNSGGLAEFQGGYYVSPFRVAVASDQILVLLDDDRIDTALAASGMVLLGVEERDTEIGLDGVGVKIVEVPVGVTRNFPRVLVTERTAAGFGDYPTSSRALITTPAGLFDGFVSPFTPLWYAESNLQLSGGGDSFSPVVLLGMAFLATLLVVLIVVATITALSAAEAQSDLEVIVAVGAKNSIRRSFLGLQSLIHTAFGALLAVPLALILVKTAITSGGSYRSLGNFSIWDSSTLVVPWGSIAALLVGMPLAVGLITALTVRSAPLTPPRRAT